MASVNSKLSKPSQFGLNLYTNELAFVRISRNRCRHARCVATAHAQCSFKVFHFHISTTIFVKETSVVFSLLSAEFQVCNLHGSSPIHQHCQYEWLFKIHRIRQLVRNLVCRWQFEKWNPGRIEILFVGVGCLHVSPIWVATKSTCIAAIDFNSFSLMSQP